MLRRRHLSTRELQEVSESITAARVEINRRKVPEIRETTRRAMLGVVETMEEWMRMLWEARTGLVKCWTTLESLEGDMGCARRYIDRMEIGSWERLPRWLSRHEYPKDKLEKARQAVEEACREVETDLGGDETEDGIERAMQIVAWTLEEWLVRSETAEVALSMGWEAYDQLRRELEAAREGRKAGVARPARQRRRRSHAGPTTKKRSKRRKSA